MFFKKIKDMVNGLYKKFFNRKKEVFLVEHNEASTINIPKIKQLKK